MRARRRLIGVMCVAMTLALFGCARRSKRAVKRATSPDLMEAQPAEARRSKGEEGAMGIAGKARAPQIQAAADEPEPRSGAAERQDAPAALGDLFGDEVGEATGFGGLGLSGSGRGGGGGVGTIGLGGLAPSSSSSGEGGEDDWSDARRGVPDIAAPGFAFHSAGKRGGRGGGGSGYGRGAGRLGDRSAKVPKVIPGKPTIRGALDREIIRRIIRRHRNEYRYCYERALNRDPSLQGKITVRFTIDATGAVIASAAADSSVGDASVAACLNQKIKRWRFPAPKGGGVVVVSYPFIFKSDGGARRPRPTRRPPPPPPPLEPLAERYAKPAAFLPRVFYFENTYLGGNVAYAERLRRLDHAFAERGWARPYRLAQLQPQGFDPPEGAGLALHAQLDRPYLDKPSRVILQVGLQGSHRYGWRRPPLDLVLLVDAPISLDPERVLDAARQLLKHLSPQDRLGVILGGAGAALTPLSAPRALRVDLARRLERPTPHPDVSVRGLERTLTAAHRLFTRGEDHARVPGTQVLLMLVEGGAPERAEAAQRHAHALSLQGVVTSVIDLAPAQGSPWWSVAHAGHGNLHGLTAGSTLAGLVEAELSSLSKVIARLLRLNVRLAPGVEIIQVIGSRPLKAPEVKAVKAREVATDRNLSLSMGLEADRGEDSDGIQTVIPYFYGGDAHVVLMELWVERAGAVADVSVEFKDMVRLRNAEAHARVALGSLPRPEDPTQRRVARNQRGFRLAEALTRASTHAARGERAAAMGALRGAAALGEGAPDQRLLEGLEGLLEAGDGDPLLVEALELSGRLRIGASGPLTP